MGRTHPTTSSVLNFPSSDLFHSFRTILFNGNLQVNISIYQANEARWDINNFPENTRKVHMSFHDNSHYASVHPSNELNSLNNKLVAKPKPKPAGPKPAIKSQNPKLSQMDIENLIKKMHNDTMLEEVIIQQTLESCDYNVDETYDILFNLRDQLFTLDSIDESQSPIIDETPQPPINTNSLTQEDVLFSIFHFFVFFKE